MEAEDRQEELDYKSRPKIKVFRYNNFCLICLVIIILFGIDYYWNRPWVFFESQPRSNSAFEDKYWQVEELGNGATSVVMKVVLREDPEGKEFVAKMFRHGFNGSAIPEADVLRRLDHPRITKIRDGFVGGWFSCTVIVMDFIPGKTLNTISKQIRTQPQNEGFLPKEKVFDWL